MQTVRNQTPSGRNVPWNFVRVAILICDKRLFKMSSSVQLNGKAVINGHFKVFIWIAWKVN